MFYSIQLAQDEIYQVLSLNILKYRNTLSSYLITGNITNSRQMLAIIMVVIAKKIILLSPGLQADAKAKGSPSGSTQKGTGQGRKDSQEDPIGIGIRLVGTELV